MEMTVDELKNGSLAFAEEELSTAAEKTTLALSCWLGALIVVDMSSMAVSNMEEESFDLELIDSSRWNRSRARRVEEQAPKNQMRRYGRKEKILMDWKLTTVEIRGGESFGLVILWRIRRHDQLEEVTAMTKVI
ncbi:hypothetical protein HA466_0141540 [Hirschfeldia incana]|nr:hypothetical protein HA466_0141540 [Hirschfeldia incana]